MGRLDGNALVELRRSSGPCARSRPILADAPEAETAFGRGRLLLCRACGLPVTAESEAVSIHGSAVHRRINPAGIAFAFGCFAAAAGARMDGEPTSEHSWFPGQRPPPKVGA